MNKYEKSTNYLFCLSHFGSILLYSKVGEPAVMQEAARVWLHCPSNSRVSGFGTVAELYLLHVLVPLGHTEEARELIVADIGSSAFTEDQRQTALDVVEEKERQNRERPPNPGYNPDSELTAQSVSTQGHTLQFSFQIRCILLS